jgi:hypothetical protein
MDTQLIPSVWVDDTHAIFHRGMVASLIADGFLIRGESARLRPTPPLHNKDVSVFDCIGPSLRQAIRLAQGKRRRAGSHGSHEIRQPQFREIVQAGVQRYCSTANSPPMCSSPSLRAVSAGSGVRDF